MSTLGVPMTKPWQQALTEILAAGPAQDGETGAWLPVASLEIQLESQLRRGKPDKADHIAAVLRPGDRDPALLRMALSAGNWSYWKAYSNGE